MDARLVRRHPDDAEERAAARLRCPTRCVRCPRPRRAPSEPSRSRHPSTPSRSLSGVLQPPACVTPQAPIRTSSIPTSSVCPARAPRTSTGPMSAWPASSSPSRSAYEGSCSASRQPELRHANAIESPGSTVRIGSRSREKWPWSVRRSSGISCSATTRRARGGRRRRPARPTACTRPRSASTGTGRRSP